MIWQKELNLVRSDRKKYQLNSRSVQIFGNQIIAILGNILCYATLITVHLLVLFLYVPFSEFVISVAIDGSNHGYLLLTIFRVPERYAWSSESFLWIFKKRWDVHKLLLHSLSKWDTRYLVCSWLSSNKQQGWSNKFLTSLAAAQYLLEMQYLTLKWQTWTFFLVCEVIPVPFSFFQNLLCLLIITTMQVFSQIILLITILESNSYSFSDKIYKVVNDSPCL